MYRSNPELSGVRIFPLFFEHAWLVGPDLEQKRKRQVLRGVAPMRGRNGVQKGGYYSMICDKWVSKGVHALLTKDGQAAKKGTNRFQN